MCGVTGIWHFEGADEARLHRESTAMTDAIAYRGPDGQGHWHDGASGVALGHRRLAIIDPSPMGFQPMVSADGRIVISYNGELYNADDISKQLAMPMRGSSDTEVLVEAIARWGVETTLHRINGIFAFATWDRQSRTLVLARDRLGVKPLYWTLQKNTFAFASELKALLSCRELSFTIDPASVATYLRHACVPAPRSIYHNVFKLRPAEWMEIRPSGNTSRCYWDIQELARNGAEKPDRRDDSAIAEELDVLLSEVTSQQMVSDVPIGAFLSGGIDSSTVVAFMQKASRRPIKTFSIGFQEKAFDESDHAAAVARHLGTEHTELTVSPSDALAVVAQLPSIYDEPFADSSQIPTFILSRLARQHVTVALSGDGGDEAFGGYVRHHAVARLWRAMNKIPLPARRIAANAMRLLPVGAWDAVGAILPHQIQPAHFSEKAMKGVGLLGASGPTEMYLRLISQWSDPARLLQGAIEPEGWVRHDDDNRKLDIPAQLRLFDMRGYLPDDILTKVDRASMAAGLEVRVPLLDQRIVEFAWRLPTNRLMLDGTGKRPLRAVLSRYVPPKYFERPKMGFGLPIGDWLRGPLKSWADDLLSPASLAKDGLFDPILVRAMQDDHVSGKRHHQHALWTLLQFQAWRHR